MRRLLDVAAISPESEESLSPEEAQARIDLKNVLVEGLKNSLRENAGVSEPAAAPETFDGSTVKRVANALVDEGVQFPLGVGSSAHNQIIQKAEELGVVDEISRIGDIGGIVESVNNAVSQSEPAADP